MASSEDKRMSELLTRTVLTAVISGGLLAGIPLMFTALGETISERAGVLNIGLEGMMLVGAYVGFVGAYYSDSFWLGFLAGSGGGMLASVFMVVLCVRLGLDQIVVGIAITLAGEGITSVLQDAQFGKTYPRLGAPSTLAIPGLSSIPVVGKSLFDQPLIVYLGLAGVVLTAWVFRKTNAGLNLRAAGEKPEALDAAGVSVLATRSYAALCTGALAGLGGAYLSIVGAGTFTPFMTQGQGFMAIVIAMLARGKPLLVVFGSFLFGISLSIATALQLAGINVSTDVVNMLPFLAIMVALVVFARRSYLAPALAIPYVRGAR
jgi:general nucleoside transport system permease protein